MAFLCFCVLPSMAAFGQTLYIDSIEELQMIGNNPAYPLNGSYALTHDIDASATAGWNGGAGFDPIGGSGAPFTGRLDGQGYIITGLVITRPTEVSTGLFSLLGAGATVEDLGLEGGMVSGDYHVGALAGYNSGGTISDCYATAAVTGEGMYVGGLVGSNGTGQIVNCHATGSASGTECIGGLVGFNGASITLCEVAVTVTGDSAVGGLAGQNFGGTVMQCEAEGSVAASEGNAGGLVGRNNFGGAVSQSSAAATVTAAGVFTGVAAGGLVGKNEANITESHAAGTASSTEYAGGLVGLNQDGAISLSYATGEVLATETAGGLVGLCWGGTISRSYANSSAVATDEPLASAGGLVGRTIGCTISECYSAGPVTAEGTSSGVAGGLTGSSSSIALSDCYSISPVTSGNHAGGLVGSLSGGSISRCYAAGRLQSASWAVGGLVSSNNGTPSITNSFWDFAATGAGSSPGGGTGFPTALMRTQNTFTDAGWDFGTVWHMLSNLTYPYLRNVPQINVPNVLDLSEAGAIAAIEAAGFVPQVTYEYSETLAPDQVVFQSPPAGYTTNAGTHVGITVIREVIFLSSIEELQLLGNDPAYSLERHYALANDIDASGTAGWHGGAGFIPIGSSDTILPQSGFTGTFDGKGHIISNLTINRPDEDYIGLFNTIGPEGVVKNLGIEGGTFAGRTISGCLAAYNSGAVSDCYATGDVRGEGYAGGLLGNSAGTVSRCYATGDVTGGIAVGGLTGNNSGPISESFASGAITGSGEYYVGGFVGMNGGPVSHCCAVGAVSGTGKIFGGLIAANSSAVTDCYATGAVTGESNSVGDIGILAGGLMGYTTLGTVSRCYSAGTVAGTAPGGIIHIGGLVGWHVDGLVEHSFWDTESSGMTESGAGMGLLTPAMQNPDTFTGAGWDFASVWQVLPGGSYPYLLNRPQHEIPDVSDMPEADAIAELEGVGLYVQVYYVYYGGVPTGHVISQSPLGGGEAIPGHSVELVVSLGPEPVPVPNIVGMTQANAETALLAAGFLVGTVGQEYTAMVPAGAVISQHPAAMSLAFSGSAVDFSVSLGTGTCDLHIDAVVIRLTRLEPSQTFQVTNENQGVMNWLIESDSDGITVSPSSGSSATTVAVEWCDFSQTISATLSIRNMDDPADVEVLGVVSTPPTDMNGDDSVNAVDIQMIINGVLGIEGGHCDVNGDGNVNAVDLQLVINAALAG